MSQVDEVENFVMRLYREGSTNNENLQILLWNLKEIVEKLERPDNELKVDGDKLVFVHLFLTKLANLYKPTKTSEYSKQILEFDSAITSQIIGFENDFMAVKNHLKQLKEKVMATHHLSLKEEEFNSGLDDLISKTLEDLYERHGNLVNQNRNILATTEQWLRNCNY